MKRNEVNRENLSPMMAQYMEIKDKYEDTLLFYRLGDFYELFFDDALIASKELELTLTGRVAGLEEKVPMCGVPHHAVKTYIEKIVNKGYKVAICEQLEDPRYTKGMVKRGVTDVISKGTIADLELLDSLSESYIASLLSFPDIYLLTLLDISTGRLLSINLNKELNIVVNEILHYQVKEVIFANDSEYELINILKNNYNIQIDISSDCNEKLPDNLVINNPRVKLGCSHLYYFLKNKELKNLDGIKDLQIIDKKEILQMDIHAIRNLELVETLRNKEREYSLIWFLDKCNTAMGSRKLKDWILNPSLNINTLNKRYDMIEKLNEEFILKDELKECLSEVYDIERLTGKVTNGSLNARDLIQLKKSIKVLPKIKEIIKLLKFDYEINTFDKLYDLLESSLEELPPISIKEGSMIKPGFNKELDELREIRSGGKSFIASFEAKVKEQTGIKNLKIGFNKVFGYYIEISKGQASEVKDEYGWERRQTLANCERFISPELKEKESMILNAEDKIVDLEYELFLSIKEEVTKEILDLRTTSENLSELDVIYSFSKLTDMCNLIRPKLNKEHNLKIIGGRHPVVEAATDITYVDNDCIMDSTINTLLITGPNMSGKSTYMRQIAITIIMAQIGCFVPCKEANLPIIDKIFTRIGASDDLVGGQSTFMVEMSEANNAIKYATENSLVIFDELGRGTATYDGMSLAESILEYITKNVKCKTLFSTHYHELTALDRKYHNIKNVHVDATLDNGKLIFLHKVKNGAASQSYGISVAALANMPNEVIVRAEEILSKYDSNKNNNVNNKIQLSFNFESNEQKENNFIEEEFNKIDPLNITPMQALNKIFELKEKITKNKKDK